MFIAIMISKSVPKRHFTRLDLLIKSAVDKKTLLMLDPCSSFIRIVQDQANYSTSSRSEDVDIITHDSDSDLEPVGADVKNVSGLSPVRYQQYHGHAPDTLFKDLIHRRQRFASYGSASGEDPRIMWPSRNVIQAMEAEEKEEFAGTLSERLSQVLVEKKAAEEEKIERRKRIEYNMSQMPKWIAEYKKKQLDNQREAKERQTKKEALLEEARDYFGYKIQANDPKFQQMVAEKEEKERAATKKRKKEEKAKKLVALMAKDMIKVSKTEEKVES